MYGPLVVYMNGRTLQFLSEEKKSIFDYATCSKQINHTLIIVAYGTQRREDYLLVRNSWLTNWADGCYFKVTCNKNICGIAANDYFGNYNRLIVNFKNTFLNKNNTD